MKPVTNYSILFSLCLLAMNACTSESSEKKAEAAPELQPLTVATFPVRFQLRQTTIQLPGDLRPYEEVEVFAKVNAYVKTLAADRGTHVRKGQRLALLEAPELAAQLSRATARWQAVRAGYLTAKTHYDRLHRISQADAGTISQNDLDRAGGVMQEAEATMQAARAEIDAVKQQNQYLIVTAPFDGVVVSRHVSAGALVGAGGSNGGKPLFVIEDSRRLRLTVAVPEKYAGQLMSIGSTVPFRVQAYPGEVFQAVFKRKSDALLQDMRAEIIELDVNNSHDLLRSGMYADLTFTTKPRKPGVTVPASSILTKAKQSFVLRLSNGQIGWVPVSRGRLMTADSVEVFGNLLDGEQLVLQPKESMKHGEQIKGHSMPGKKELTALQ